MKSLENVVALPQPQQTDDEGFTEAGLSGNGLERQCSLGKEVSDDERVERRMPSLRGNPSVMTTQVKRHKMKHI